MIQRNKKQEVKKISPKSKKKNEPMISNHVKLITGSNKLVNENNITITMPQPIIKKKRKNKPKISDEAKKIFQETLEEFKKGDFIIPSDLPDISTIKTTDGLNNLTNQLRLTMKKPLLAIKGGTQNLALPTTGIRPPIVEPYLGTIGNAYTNIQPALPPVLPPPPAPALPPTTEQKIQNEVLKQLDKSNWVDSITLYILNSGDKTNYDNLIKNILPLTIDNNTAYKTIKNRLNQLFSKLLTPVQLEQKAKYYMEIYINLRSRPQIPLLFLKLLDAITFIISNDEAKKEISDKDKRSIFDFYTDNSDYFDKITLNDINKYITYYVNTNEAYRTKDKDLYILKIRHVLTYFTDDIAEITADDPINTQIEKLQLTFEEINTVVNETPEESNKVENINENPELFYDTYYPKPDNIYKEVKGHPFVTELKNIIKLVNPKVSINKLKDKLIVLFKDEYNIRYHPIPEPLEEPLKEPAKLYKFIRDYYTDGVFKDIKNSPPTKEDIINYAIEFIKPKNNKKINNKWDNYETKYKKDSKILRPTLANEFYSDFIKLYENQPDVNPYKEPSLTDDEKKKVISFETQTILNKFKTDYSNGTEFMSDNNNDILAPTIDELIKMIKILKPSYTDEDDYINAENYYNFNKLDDLTEQEILGKLFIKFFNDHDVFESLPTVEPKQPAELTICETARRSAEKVCRIVTREDMDLLKSYEQDEDLEQLQILYKKYFAVNFIYIDGRESIGERVYDIIYNFKHNGEDEFRKKAPDPTITPEVPILTRIKLLEKFFEDYYPNDTFTKNSNTDPTIEKLKEMILLVDPTFTSDSLDQMELGEIFKRKYVSTLDPKFQHEEICLGERKEGKCIKLSKYYEYLNYLSTNMKDQELTTEYIKATKDTFKYVDRNNNVKIQKIKDSGYLPTRTENADFFNWVEGSQVDPSIVIYKNDVINLNASTDEEKINKYFEGLMRWNGRVGKIERLKRNMTTQEKLDLLIKYKDDYQYIDSIEINNTSDIKSNVNNNEVELAYKVTNVSYDDDDRPRRIDQLLYLDKYSNRNVSIYQDGSTIYFCSTGSQTDFSGQAAEDWLQSNIAILIGVSTNTLSPRFSEEQKVLNEIVMVFNPAIVIFTGHSLGGRLSNELFIYSIEKYKFQGFSISFNAGSVMGSSVDFTKKFNTEYINNRMLQFHVNYDPLSTGNMMGTVVQLPAHYDLSHKLSNFSDFNWTHYENFVQSGLQFTNPFNPVDAVVEEDQPVTEPDDEDSNFDQAAPEPRLQEPITPDPEVQLNEDENTIDDDDEAYIHLPYFGGHP